MCSFVYYAMCNQTSIAGPSLRRHASGCGGARCGTIAEPGTCVGVVARGGGCGCAPAAACACACRGGGADANQRALQILEEGGYYLDPSSACATPIDPRRAPSPAPLRAATPPQDDPGTRPSASLPAHSTSSARVALGASLQAHPLRSRLGDAPKPDPRARPIPPPSAR